MTSIPLRLGPLAAQGYVIRRSGLRWLVADGQTCRPGEAVAFCNVGFTRDGAAPNTPPPFPGEILDLQAVLATPVGGRLRHAPQSSRGGFLDRLDHFMTWTADFVIGAVEPAPGQAADDADGELRLTMATGRRAAELAENRVGLLTGWHDRSRAWRTEAAPMGTLLSLGICELAGVIKGERSAFLELLEAASGAAHVAFIGDECVVPTARALAEQIRRTPAERADIARDLAANLAGGDIIPAPADWIFAGALLNALMQSPITDRYDILARDGLRRVGPADAILLSINSEPLTILRHRRLGYSLQCHAFRLASAGHAVQAWLHSHFEQVRRTDDDILADLITLIDLVRARAPATQFLITNAISTSGFEDVQSYAAYDAPLGAALISVRDKNFNLMLHDLARSHDVAIVDVDAIAAEMGIQRSAPDGLHQNGAMQSAVRAEILAILHARGVPGFAPAGRPN